MAAVLGPGGPGPGGPVDPLAALDAEGAIDACTRWDAADPAARRIAESQWRIGGMHCAACGITIEEALKRQPGVLDARVSVAGGCATVRWDAARTRASAIARAVHAAGYEAAPDTAAAARDARRAESRKAIWRLFVAAFCAMQVMMLATPSYFGHAGELAPDHRQLLDLAAWMLTLPVLVFSAAPFFAGAWRALRARRLGMDVPVALGIAVAFVASSGAAFDPGGWFGHEVYFDSLTMFVGFLLGARWLELRARHHAETRLEDATLRLPDLVLRIAADGGIESVGAAALRPGDRVRVPAGQAFAADGVVLAGRTLADEALLSGESRPAPKAPGDPVVAGSINLGAPVEMRVDRVGADTRYEAIVALMRAARGERPALLARADRFAVPFLAAVLLLACGAAAAWSVIDPKRAVWVFVSVLVVTCPCALSLAAPSALLAAAGTLGRGGLLLRRLDAIQALAQMQRLYVDKTGTLTARRLEAAADGGEAAWLPRAASLAAWSTHPLARALRAAAPQADAVAWSGVQELPGHGVEARDGEGRLWRLGRPRWVDDRADGGAGDADEGSVALGRDGRLLARFRFAERVRDDARAALDALRAEGVQVALLSGDAPDRVQRIAAQLGIDAAAGGMTPEGKRLALCAAQRRGEVVAMLGDGINDAPVLAQADLSIAMGEGAAVARAEADGVLVGERLEAIVRGRTLAKKTMRVIHQNLAWAAVYNACCVPLALAGWLPPWAAGLGMALSSLVVVLNASRLSRPAAG